MLQRVSEDCKVEYLLFVVHFYIFNFSERECESKLWEGYRDRERENLKEIPYPAQSPMQGSISPP